MFSKLILTWLVASITFFIFYSCSDSTNPNPVSNDAYMVLNIGDIRQVITAQDSSTQLWEIIDTTKRVDGLKVFIGKRVYGISDTAKYTSFYALKDGYYIATELDTVRDEPSYVKENPFREQRLAKIYPKNGESWVPIPGGNLNHIVTAKNGGNKILPSGTFDNVYGFHFNHLTITVYYAKGAGYIATSYSEDSLTHVTTYLKVNGREYGKLFPPKDPSVISEGPGLAARKHFTGYGFFGEKIDR